MPRFSIHYVIYTFLFMGLVFSVVQIVTATTPNPGHPWAEVGDGVFAVTNNQTAVRTYTFPDANATVLTTNALVTVPQGGTGVGSLASNGVLYGNGTGAVQALAVNAGAVQCLTQASSAAPAWGACGSSYTFSTGLTNTSGTITSNLSTGIAGGQSVIGGTAAGENLTLSSTSNATKGKILFGNSGYDEVNNRLGLGTNAPGTQLTNTKTVTNSGIPAYLSGTSNVMSNLYEIDNGVTTQQYNHAQDNELRYYGFGGSVVQYDSAAMSNLLTVNHATFANSSLYPVMATNSYTSVDNLSNINFLANLRTRNSINGTSTVTTYSDLFLSSPNLTGGTVTNYYSIYQEYASAMNYLAGNLGIGVLTPAAKLDIADTTLAGSGALAGSALNIAQTWNTTGVPTAIKLNVTNTASGAGSKLIDLQVGASSKFLVRADGITQIQGNTANTNRSDWAVNLGGSLSTTVANTSSDALGIYAATVLKTYIAGSGNIATVGKGYFGAPTALTTPTALLHLGAGTATANTAPLKFTAGTNLTTAEAGAMEFDGTHLYITDSTPTRQTLAYTSDLTSGYIPYTGGTSNVDLGAHNLTVDTNSLFVDSTNHRVGVGTVGPSYPLDVSSVGDIARFISTSGRASVYISGGAAAYGQLINTVGDFYLQNNSAAGNTIFRTNTSTEGMRITSSGIVGIGNASPTTARLVLGDTTLAGSGALAGGVLDIAQTWNTTGNPTAIKLNVTNTASGASSQLMDLQVGGSSKFNIDKVGGVNMGNTLVLGQTSSSVGSLNFFNTNVGIDRTGISGLQFRTGSSVVGMTLDTSGDLGIGETSPLTRLDVRASSNSTITSLSVVPGTAVSALFGNTGTNGVLAIGQDNASHAYLQGRSRLGDGSSESLLLNPLGGNVGIGTTTPSQLLTINSGGSLSWDNGSGTADTGLSRSAAATIRVGNGTPGDYSGTLVADTFYANKVYTLASGNPLVLGIGGAEKMRIDGTTGNVGIQTTTPSTNFQVAQSATGPGTVTNLAGGTTVTGVGTNFTNTFKVGDTITIGGQTVAISAIASDTSMTTAAITAANSGVAYTLTGGTRFSVLGNGNVGIGNPSPSAKLDIADTTLAGSGALAGSVLNLAQTWNTTGTPTAIKLNVTNTASNAASKLIDLQAGGTSLFNVGANGNTQVGTLGLNQFLLDVGNTAGQSSMRLVTYAGSGNQIIIGNGPSSLGGLIYTRSYNTGLYLPFNIDGNPITLNNNGGSGGVGIGVSPSAALDVADTTFAGSGALAASVLNLAQTWNTTGNPTAIKLNVTNTASGASSNLLDLQVASSSKFKVDKAGVATIAGGLTSSGTITFSGLASAGTQCAQLSSAGILSGTGSACGSGGGLTVGTSAISGGTSGNVLYNNAGVLGEMTTSGSGTQLALTTSPSFTTSVIGSASFDAFNTVSTTLNIGGAATTFALGGTPTTTVTANIFTNATAAATTKTINFGTGGAASSTTNINIGSANGGTTTVNSPLTSTGLITANGGLTVAGGQNLTMSSGSGQFSQTYTGTTTNANSIASSSLSSGTLLDLAVTGTAGLTNQKGINVSLSGANGTGAQTTYGAYLSNTHTGTSNNVGLYATASGGSNNYAAIFDQGNVGIGTTSPTNSLDLGIGGTGLRVQGFFNETTTNVGVYMGVNTFDTTPRVMFANGTASQNWQIDNSAGRFRWYLPNDTEMMLTTTTLSLGNVSDKTIKLFDSSTDAAGKSLTLIGGSTVAGTSVNDVNGGNLNLAAGLGTGAGTSTIAFQTGTTLGSGLTLQTLSTKMTILGNGNVGIGDTTPAALLTVGSGDLFQVDSSGNVNTSGTISTSNGSGANSERFGLSSVASGSNSVALGHGASNSGSSSTVLGTSASTNANWNTVIGTGASITTGTDAIAIGEGAVLSGTNDYSILIGVDSSSSATHTVGLGGNITSLNNDSVALGYQSATTAANQFVAGSGSSPKNDVYFGKGVVNATPTAYTINGTGGTGTDIAGGILQLAGGKATGNATGGSIAFQTSDAGTTGTTLQTLTTKATLLASGNFGIGDSTPASLFTVGSGDLFQVNSSGAIAAATGITTTGTISLTSANTTQTTTSSALALNLNSLTTGTGLYAASSTLSSGALADLEVTGTAGLTGQKGLNVSLSGANGTGAQTTYGAYLSNTHTGTSNNVGLYATASGGSNNYAAIFDQGNVGIGTTVPRQNLQVIGNLEVGAAASGAKSYRLRTSGGSLDFEGSGASMFYSIWSGTDFTGTQNNYLTLNSASHLATAHGDWTFYTGNSGSTANVFTIESETYGNVGVQTTNPTTNFQVAQGTAGFGTVSNGAGGTTVTGVGTRFTNTFKVGDTITANGETHTISAIASNTSMTTDTWTGANSGVAYTLVGGTRFSVLGNGNVGIGNTSPTSMFSVGSTSQFQVNSSGSIAAATGITTTGTISLTSANTTQTTTSSALALNLNSLTTGTGLYAASSTLSSGALADLEVTGTAGLTGQKGINVSLSGANGTGAQTTYGAYLSNTHTGTSNNVGLYATASGGSNNYAAIFDQGRILAGLTSETTSDSKIYIQATNADASGGATGAIAGIHENLTFNPSAGGTQVGNRYLISNAPTTSANTSVGEIIRTTDNTTLANTVRGIEIVSNVGSNTAGTNTGLRATGATFGVQGFTNGTAGAVAVPAALYGENTGTTSGDILRLYSGSVTSASALATFYQDTSTFTGTGLLMNLAVTGGFTGDFVNFKKAGTSEFKITNAGVTSMGLSGTASTTAVCSSLATNTAPTAGTSYEIRDCSGAPVVDYAEMYPVATDADYGDVMAMGPETVEYLADDGYGNTLPNAPRRKVAKLIKADQPYQSNVVGIMSLNYGDFSSVGHNLIDPKDNPKPIALNGRVPVKISNSSPALVPGDYITTSTDPGKATKAIKAGTVIGKVLEAWTPNNGQDTAMVFVEQGYYNGESVSDFAGIVVDSTTTAASDTIGKMVLTQLLSNQQNQNTSTNFPSELLTDRITAGLEIITPSLTADKVAVNTISVATGNDISLVLSPDGKFIISGQSQNPDGSITSTPAITIDSLGNATFAGKIIANAVEFNLPPLFNKDTAGFALIKQGDSRVHILFSQPYIATPVVNASISFESTDNVDDAQASALFANNVRYIIVAKDQTGFTILLNKQAPRDMRFSWNALSVKDPSVFVSVLDGLTIEPTSTTSTTPTSTSTSTPTTDTTTPSTTTDTTTSPTTTTTTTPSTTSISTPTTDTTTPSTTTDTTTSPTTTTTTTPSTTSTSTPTTDTTTPSTTTDTTTSPTTTTTTTPSTTSTGTPTTDTTTTSTT